MRRLLPVLIVLLCASAATAAPLVIGETFTLESKILGETRRINVYPPPDYSATAATRLPVLYMPDGGMAEDFLHIAGLVQISTANASMRPFVLVGIENTQRRRDMTGPTQNDEDRKIAPKVGGSKAFRDFLRDELMPAINARYRTTGETAIIGESLAGLFVVETLLLEPALFDTYIAIDPSLWWNDRKLIGSAATHLAAIGKSQRPKRLFFASSNEPGIIAGADAFEAVLRESAPKNLQWMHDRMPEETHGTIYHPAALRAVRRLK